MTTAELEKLILEAAPGMRPREESHMIAFAYMAAWLATAGVVVALILTGHHPAWALLMIIPALGQP
jgi:hypothetical protein